MKKFVISLLSVIFLCAAATAQVLVGMTDTTAYFPQLEGRRVAVLANHTAVARFGCRGRRPTGRYTWSTCCTGGVST